MSAKHEQAIMIRQSSGLTSLKNATLQAGTPAFQSVAEFAPSVFVHRNFLINKKRRPPFQTAFPINLLKRSTEPDDVWW
jgi:hypothetical protein